jgi:hypothetical protein
LKAINAVLQYTHTKRNYDHLFVFILVLCVVIGSRFEKFPALISCLHTAFICFAPHAAPTLSLFVVDLLVVNFVMLE